MSHSLRTRIIIFIIIIISAGLRIYNIEQKNLWFDEVYSWKISQGSVVQIVSETSGDIHPPLYYVILKYWIQLFSDSIFSMRMFSVLLSLLSIYFIYKISKSIFKSDLQIILVLLLFALSPLNIYYSQEVRMLNLNLFLCLGSVFYFFETVKSPGIKPGILYILFTILALYTHYFALLILFSELILIFVFYKYQNINNKTFTRYLYYFLIVNILYLPWYPVFFKQISRGQPWRHDQSVPEIAGSLLSYFNDIFLSIYYPYESNAVYYFSIFFGILTVTFIIFSVLKIINSKEFFTDRRNSIILLFCIPLLAALIISFRNGLLLSRYLSILVPYLFIMIVYLSFKIYNVKTALVISFFYILTSIYGIQLNFNNGFKNNDYRKIISYVENNFKTEDEIIVEPHFMGWSLNYNIKRNNSGLKEPLVLGWDLNMQLKSLKEKSDVKNVWFILDYSALDKTGYDSLSYLMNELGYRKSAEKMFYIMPAKVSVEYYIKSF